MSFIRADQMGLELPAARQLYRDFLAVLDHMVVGDDVAARIDDESGTHGLRAESLRPVISPLSLAALPLPLPLTELPEEIAERRGDIVQISSALATAFGELAVHNDGDYGRADMFDKVGKAEWRALFDQPRRRIGSLTRDRRNFPEAFLGKANHRVAGGSVHGCSPAVAEHKPSGGEGQRRDGSRSSSNPAIMFARGRRPGLEMFGHFWISHGWY